ncbi:hypothetical protein DL770_010330 [Monosporascus sp. CRB-9-2]|nr:hypothetical protein DL770_010330 [Monosporascus sp. CRB-9-2]
MSWIDPPSGYPDTGNCVRPMGMHLQPQNMADLVLAQVKGETSTFFQKGGPFGAHEQRRHRREVQGRRHNCRFYAGQGKAEDGVCTHGARGEVGFPARRGTPRDDVGRLAGVLPRLFKANVFRTAAL